MSTDNLSGKEGIEKLKELTRSADVCLFATSLLSNPIPSRPMSTRDVDDDGCIWFFSRSTSSKNTDIKRDQRVQLFYSNPGRAEFLNIAGKAEIIIDPAKANELWSAWVRTWFPEGPDDPELTLIKVTPWDVRYWDTKNNRMISLVKIVAGALAGKEMDLGVEGKIMI